MSEERSYRVDPGYPFGASVAVVPLDVYTTDAKGEEVLTGSATAFCDVLGSQRYLITSWHNVTGRDPATGQPREKDCVTPPSASIFPSVFLKQQTGLCTKKVRALTWPPWPYPKMQECISGR
jgi:hypothetical protein